MAWSRESRHRRGYGSAWDKLRAQAMKRDKWLCQPCRAKGRPTPATECDHITPKAKGGTDALTNLQAICADCHRDKTDRDEGRAARVRFGADGRVEW